MGTPNSTSVVNDLATTLATITTGGGYKTTVAEVTRFIQVFEGATDRPSLGIGKGRVSYEYANGGLIRCTLPITIVGHVLGDTPAARLTAIENLLDDIIAAVHSDATRGGDAIVTTVVSSEDDLSMDHGLSHLGGGASLVVELSVKWDRTTGSS